jgi:hypothetical protein
LPPVDIREYWKFCHKKASHSCFITWQLKLQYNTKRNNL